MLQKPLSLAYLLRKQNSDAKEITYNAYLGIRTPGLQAISRSPKYSVPIIYCKGLPLALSTHSCRSFRRAAQSLMMCPVLRCGSATKSLSHRSSFFADVRSRVARSTSGSNGSFLCAWCKTRGCRRGIAERQGCCYCSFSRQTSLRRLMLLSQRKRALRKCLCVLGIRASVSDAGQAFTQAMPSSRSKPDCSLLPNYIWGVFGKTGTTAVERLGRSSRIGRTLLSLLLDALCFVGGEVSDVTTLAVIRSF